MLHHPVRTLFPSHTQTRRLGGSSHEVGELIPVTNQLPSGKLTVCY